MVELSAGSFPPTRTGPLSHIRVLDLGRIMAAPWATQIMADLGADVIKVERPRVGDDTRTWGPPFLNASDGFPTREAGYYLAVNRGKRSVTLDIANPEAQALIRRLASSADVVMENFKVGALARYDLDAASLRRLNPQLIYCSITGFGQDGPRRDQPAYDFAIQAMGGLMSVTGGADDAPGGGPQKVGVPIVDLMTGMYAVTAVLAALVRRAETGDGETIDTAMLDVASALLANQSMNWLLTGKAPRRTGNRHPNIQPQDVFDCADGQFVLAVGNDAQFAKLCKAIDRPSWAKEAKFRTNAARVAAGAELTGLLTERFAYFSREAIARVLNEAGVPCAPINDIEEVFKDAQLKHRRMLQELPHPLSGTLPQVVSPLRFETASLGFGHAAPTLGQHNGEVFAELGLSGAEIDAMTARGVC